MCATAVSMVLMTVCCVVWKRMLRTVTSRKMWWYAVFCVWKAWSGTVAKRHEVRDSSIWKDSLIHSVSKAEFIRPSPTPSPTPSPIQRAFSSKRRRRPSSPSVSFSSESLLDYGLEEGSRPGWQGAWGPSSVCPLFELVCGGGPYKKCFLKSTTRLHHGVFF